MLELTSSVKIPAFSLMKILLLRPFQCSGSTPPQKSTSQPLSGGILGTLWCDFLELSPLLGTGTTGSKSTSSTSGRMGAEENRFRYPRCWSLREIYSRSNKTYGAPTPSSVVSIWRITLKGNFSLIKLPQSGLQVVIDAMTLSALLNRTWLETKVRMWTPFMMLEEANIEFSQYLMNSYPTPYWCSEPYSGKGRKVIAPDWHRHSIASISFSDNAPIVLYQ